MPPGVSPANNTVAGWPSTVITGCVTTTAGGALGDCAPVATGGSVGPMPVRYMTSDSLARAGRASSTSVKSLCCAINLPSANDETPGVAGTTVMPLGSTANALFTETATW